MIKQLNKEENMTQEQEAVLSYAGIVSTRAGGNIQSSEYINRVNNFDGVVRPLLVPDTL